jgi:hypothetical protein
MRYRLRKKSIRERSAISRNTEPTRNENKSKEKGMKTQEQRKQTKAPEEQAQQAKEAQKGMCSTDSTGY